MLKMNKISYLPILVFAFYLSGCDNNNDVVDAYGNFEATEILISSEANGKLMEFNIVEGKVLMVGERIGLVDTIPLYLKKRQLQARIEALNTKTLNIPSQINVLIERKNVIEREKQRVENLFKEGAATQKQLDDIIGEIDVINKELKANKERLETNNRGLLSEILPIEWQIEEINDQINKSVLINPTDGIVLNKYAEQYEIVNYGKPLYQIASLNALFLRAYVGGDVLNELKLGQDVKVYIDEGKDDLKEYSGVLSWISEKAEFTPKIVQTKEERVNLVYAVKILVNNDGSIKIGMPGEVKFN
jgi:HlyD family secretion protein